MTSKQARNLSLMLMALMTSTSACAEHSIEDRIEQFGGAVAQRLAPDFKRAGIAYPPKSLAILAFKNEMRVDLYAADALRKPRYIRSMAIDNISGQLGPKLREGDQQVPEGVYTVGYLIPNSAYHLAVPVSYPNAFDRDRAAEDGRDRLGVHVMFHGEGQSRGCVVLSDEDAENLFVLAQFAGVDGAIKVIISPVDFRKTALAQMPAGAPHWTRDLYHSIGTALRDYPPQ